MLRLISCVFFLFINQVYAQGQGVVGFEQIETLQKKEERLVMVLVETDWCKYCQAMKSSIRKDKKLSAVLEKSFYTIFLDAETKRDIHFGGKVFRFKPTGVNTGVHELAEELGTVDRKLAFPTLCFLNKKNEIVYQHIGFIDSPSFIKLLNALLAK